jgi:hypothetical protein
MYCRVRQDGGRSVVYAHSESRVPLTIADWGKNRDNVDRVLGGLFIAQQ